MSILGYFQSGYFSLGLVTKAATGTYPDFLAALEAYWQADPYLTALTPKFHLGLAPAKTPRPYVECHGIKGKVGGRNTGRGYWQDRSYQFSIWTTNADTGIAWGETIITELDKIASNKLTFTNGYQMAFWLADDNLDRAREFGRGGSIDWPVTLTYTARIGRARQ